MLITQDSLNDVSSKKESARSAGSVTEPAAKVPIIDPSPSKRASKVSKLIKQAGTNHWDPVIIHVQEQETKRFPGVRAKHLPASGFQQSRMQYSIVQMISSVATDIK